MCCVYFEKVPAVSPSIGLVSIAVQKAQVALFLEHHGVKGPNGRCHEQEKDTAGPGEKHGEKNHGPGAALAKRFQV
jgi:hypothetical protein